ncbi:hypothetical protein ACIHFD_67445 [Nonomuraea sp. NPDC051941]|uniref:hypothetical protein n=1 Tax=Nonomuraea sp. NPDC051941 TaxID=3364373 RepID=UPI0037C53267
MTGTGIRDVIEYAGAPQGSFQHYFPGGKDQLVGEALLWAGDFVTERVASYAHRCRPVTGRALRPVLLQKSLQGA